jgi:threonine dehydrogenase-like Zn-dependent dehydrogenase
MKALILKAKNKLAITDMEFKETVGPDDVKIKIHTVGICGSDVHYYTHGKIGRSTWIISIAAIPANIISSLVYLLQLSV